MRKPSLLYYNLLDLSFQKYNDTKLLAAFSEIYHNPQWYSSLRRIDDDPMLPDLCTRENSSAHPD